MNTTKSTLNREQELLMNNTEYEQRIYIDTEYAQRIYTGEHEQEYI